MNDNASSATMQLSGNQATIIVALERTGASLSVLGVLLIIITFALFKRLRTVPNTFILFASIANIGASIASLIGLAGIEAGSTSSLCRAQAFLLEMFMQSDPWWSFAMAFNVFLVFFFSANPTTFRRHLWMYCVVCFGLPMIPAIVCLYIKNKTQGPVYGDATLWCWINDEWNSLRIYSYYIPIWTCIFFSAFIYIAVGYHVFHQRNQLRNISLSNPTKETSSSENLTTSNSGFYGTVTTEVKITSDVCEAATGSASAAVTTGDCSPPQTPVAVVLSSAHCPWTTDGPFPQVTTNVHAQRFHHNSFDRSFPFDEEAARHLPPSSSSPTPSLAMPMPVIHGASGQMTPTTTTTVTATAGHFRSPSMDYATTSRGGTLQSISSSGDATVVASADTAMGTISTTRPSKISTTATTATRTTTIKASTATLRRGWPPLFARALAPIRNRFRRMSRHMTSKLHHMDPIKLAYLRTSFVFAISVLVTWTPSSINRVYTIVHPERNISALNIASAAVLPLQGVWNAIIYFTTSWTLLREEAGRLAYRSRLLHRWANTHLHPMHHPDLPLEQRRPMGPADVGAGDRGRQASAGGPGRAGGRQWLGSRGSEDGDGSSLDDLGQFRLEDGSVSGRRLGHSAIVELELRTRAASPPRLGTLRVQKGCALDS